MIEKIPFDINSAPLFSSYLPFIKDKGAFSSFIYLYSFASTTLSASTYLCENDGVLFYGYDYADKKNLFVIGKKNGADLTKSIQHMHEHLGNLNIRMYENEFNAVSGDFIFDEDRNSFEYIYAGDKIRNLEGREYHSKRTFIRNFRKLYPDIKTRKCTLSDKEKCINFINEWSSKDENINVKEEKLATIKSLDFLENDAYQSIIALYGDKIIAFSAGVMLDDNTALIMFEKADINYKGAYPFINQTFLESSFKTAEFINRDQDIGSDGLRKAKLSYHPSFFKKVYLTRIN